MQSFNIPELRHANHIIFMTKFFILALMQLSLTLAEGSERVFIRGSWPFAFFISGRSVTPVSGKGPERLRLTNSNPISIRYVDNRYFVYTQAPTDDLIVHDSRTRSFSVSVPNFHSVASTSGKLFVGTSQINPGREPASVHRLAQITAEGLVNQRPVKSPLSFGFRPYFQGNDGLVTDLDGKSYPITGHPEVSSKHWIAVRDVKDEILRYHNILTRRIVAAKQSNTIRLRQAGNEKSIWRVSKSSSGYIVSAFNGTEFITSVDSNVSQLSHLSLVNDKLYFLTIEKSAFIELVRFFEFELSNNGIKKREITLPIYLKSSADYAVDDTTAYFVSQHDMLIKIDLKAL